ncbi:MAG: hypothetical protein LBF24_01505, partial [Puniceicoccales bacterium]|nr:hypothetical protein [Puniceicoccales bacterium]
MGRYGAALGFIGLVGWNFSFGIDDSVILVRWTDPAEVGIESAIQGAADGCVLLFPESVFVFETDSAVCIGKNIALRGEGPQTLLKKVAGRTCGFFNFTGAAGGVENIAFDGQTLAEDGGALICSDNFANGIHNSLFVENTCNSRGGALCCADFYGDLCSSIFAQNTAQNGGGAAFVCLNFKGSEGNFCDLGNSYFLRNRTEAGHGGALLVNGSAELAAKTGDVIFQGNSADGHREGIFFENDQCDDTVKIGAESGRTFYCYDPIRSSGNEGQRDLVWEINPLSTQTGTVLWDGYRSEIWFEGGTGATVSYGTMVLQNGASFGAGEGNFAGQDGNYGSFTLGESATLRIGYEQLSKNFNIESGKVCTAYEWPIYSKSNVSEINAFNTILSGTLQFLLPTNVTANDVLLRFPYGDVQLTDTAKIAVGAVGTLQSLLIDESVVLIQCDGETLSGREDYSNSTGEELENFCVPGYVFAICRNDTQLLATLVNSESAPSYLGRPNPPEPWPLFPIPSDIVTVRNQDSEDLSSSGSIVSSRSSSSVSSGSGSSDASSGSGSSSSGSGSSDASSSGGSSSSGSGSSDASSGSGSSSSGSSSSDASSSSGSSSSVSSGSGSSDASSSSGSSSSDSG